MRIECPKCKYSGNIADQLVPEEGRTVGCPKCKERFFIQKQIPHPAIEAKGQAAEEPSHEPVIEEKSPPNVSAPGPPPVTKASSEMVYCRGCGKEIHLSARSCPHCGAVVKKGAPKNRMAAGLLALFLGGIGIHRFYLGQGVGCLYLLFCWTFIPAIIAFIEAIIFFTTSDEEWSKKYG
jgi:predicted Zn finger-like uncharacterized protein